MTDRNDDNLPARLVPPEPGETGRSHWRVTPWASPSWRSWPGAAAMSRPSPAPSA